MLRRAWIGLFPIVLVVGCSGRMVGGGGHDGGADAGPVTYDAGTDGGQVVVDAGSDAGALPDSGPPDGGPPPCACPTFPDACTVPAANEPTFTPDADAMLGQLFDVIACADTTLHIAMYEALWPCIGDALRTALDRNAELTIQIVVDDDNCAAGACFFDDLPTDRVTVVRDARSAYMHGKWVIADGTRVWLGSANFSERSMCVDHNNAIVVEQPEAGTAGGIVTRYEEVFAALFGGAFGPSAQPVVTSGEYSVYFSPESPTTQPPQWQDDIIAAMDAATTRIDVMMNAWTQTAFSDALIAAHERGVTVRVLVSSLYASDAPAQAALAAGIEVRRANIHDKLVVIDDSVFTGSANWSENARSNNEDVLRVDGAAVAALYAAEMDRIFASATPVTAP